MKKCGYTLQELLITMGIVGVIAALTVPMITGGSYKQSNATKMAALAGDFENSLTTLLVKESINDLTEYDGELLSNFGIQGLYNAGNSGTYIGTQTKSGRESAYQIKYDKAYVARNGAFIFVKMEDWHAVQDLGTYMGNVYFDVNGEQGPNKAGRDIFGYVLAASGHIFPIGSEMASLLEHDNSDNCWNRGTNPCMDGNLVINCTARLAEKGYKVDY